MALWRSISSAFFAVFIMVSAISVHHRRDRDYERDAGGRDVRRREIGVRRAVGATQTGYPRQFIAESVMQCLVGGVIGVGLGFLVALALRTYTPFPASVQTWVAVLGMVLSSAVGFSSESIRRYELAILIRLWR